MNNLGQLGRPVALLCAALALGLPSLGCGAASAGHRADATTTTRTAPGAVMHTQSISAPCSANSSGRASIVNGCVSHASGDPGAMGLCLAKHHLTVPDSGKIVTCVQAASTRTDVTACLAKAAQP